MNFSRTSAGKALVGFAVGAAIVIISVGCGGASDSLVSSAAPQFTIDQVKSDPGFVQNEKNREAGQALIDEVEASGILKLGADGFIQVQPSTRSAQPVSQAAKQFAEEAVKQANQLVSQKAFVVNDDFSLTSPARANEQGARHYWWGTRYAVNHDNCVRIQIGAAALALFLGSAPAGWFSFITGAVVWWCDRNSTGMFVYVPRPGGVWCVAQ